MALKSKFERIDQSKLKQGARDVLAKMKDKSENFTNTEVNKKIEPAIDKLIERLKKENPDALKKASATRTRKPKTTAKKKATKKAPAKKGGAKRETVMTVAKRIRKDGEKWQDALKRAKSEMGKDTKKKVSAVKTEVDKLKQLIEKDAVLKGFSNSELQRDAVRKAKPRGKRKTSTKGETTNQYGTYKNKVGRTYWESRENRSDRYAPKYPKNKPFLEMGGDITDAQDLSMANSDFLVMAKGGSLSKEELKLNLYKPSGDYFMDKKDGKIILHLTSKDALNLPPSFFEKYNVEKNGKGYYGTSYIVSKKMAKGGEIDAFTMSMVKGVDDGVSEIETKDLKARMEKGGRLSARTNFTDFDLDRLSYDFVVFNDRVETESGKVVGTINSKGHLIPKGDKTLKNPLVKWLQQNSYVTNEEYYKLEKGGEIEYDNDENEAVGNFLLNTKDGREILEKSKNSSQLKKEVVEYHTKKGIPNWEFEDDDDEGIDWVTFGDLYDSVKDLKARMEKGGEIDLFEDYEKQPKELAEIVEVYEERYADGDMDYESTKEFLDKVNAIGYTFDSGLDNEPYNLRPIMAKGGVLDFDVLVDNKPLVQISKDDFLETYNVSYYQKDLIPKSVLSILNNKKELTREEAIEVLKKLRNDKSIKIDVALPFAKGGRLKSALMRDRKYYNKNESWERSYSKGKNRKGYKERGGTISNSTQHFSIMETDTPIYKEGGQIDMDL